MPPGGHRTAPSPCGSLVKIAQFPGCCRIEGRSRPQHPRCCGLDRPGAHHAVRRDSASARTPRPRRPCRPAGARSRRQRPHAGGSARGGRRLPGGCRVGAVEGRWFGGDRLSNRLRRQLRRIRPPHSRPCRPVEQPTWRRGGQREPPGSPQRKATGSPQHADAVADPGDQLQETSAFRSAWPRALSPVAEGRSRSRFELDQGVVHRHSRHPQNGHGRWRRVAARRRLGTSRLAMAAPDPLEGRCSTPTSPSSAMC